MRIKRTTFALLIIIFALSGCMSTLPVSSTKAIYQIYSDANRPSETALALTSEVVSVEYQTEDPEIIYSDETGDGGVSWILGKVQDGVPGKRIENYNVTKDIDGNIVSKTLLLDSVEDIAAVPEIVRYGADVAVGNVFFPKMTTYGVDCAGCNGEDDGEGNTGMGIKLSTTNGVLQPSGIWQPGITYGGYYMVAADSTLPLCTVLEIKNHSYSGAGLTPGVPFKALVVDRGGGVKGSHLDLYIGSQKASPLTKKGNRTPEVEIVRVGGKTGKACAL